MLCYYYFLVIISSARRVLYASLHSAILPLPQENPPSLSRWSVLPFLVVWLLSAVYLGVNLKRCRVPHDDGMPGQAAECVLQGEMPHRDFEDPYTGGLSYVHAAAFRLTALLSILVNPSKFVDVLRFGAYDVEHKRHNSSVQTPGSGVKYYIDAPKALIAFSVKPE
jgi:hypothetical protein